MSRLRSRSDVSVGMDRKYPLRAGQMISARKPKRSVLLARFRLAPFARNASSTIASPNPLPDALLCRPEKSDR